MRWLLARSPSPLAGVWHAAGVLADGVLPSQTGAMAARVYAPKAHGAWTLQAACAPAPLRACTLFSSVAALLGGAGQSNYSAANACLDVLSVCRRSHGSPSVSVQWGAWAEVGMAARGAASARMAAMEAASGFGRIGLAQGLSALAAAVQPCGTSVVGVVPVVWSRMLGVGGAVPGFLSAFAPIDGICGSSARSARGMSSPGSEAVTLESVLAMVQRTAGGAVDADSPLMESGVDSLGAVELRNQLQAVAGEGVSLPSTLIFDHPTARQVAMQLFGSGSGACCSSAVDSSAVSVASRVQHGESEVIGVASVSMCLPGGVSELADLHSMSHGGHDLLSEIPLTRWEMDHVALEAEGVGQQVVSRVRHGAFLRGADLFEAASFSISAAEAAAMDPQQRLLLERGYAALAGAQLSRSALSGREVAVNVGQWASDFGSVLAGTPAGRSVYASTGFSCSVTCGRVSFVLGLHGPCASYDTACSASLVAAHGSVRALQRGECEVALSAGVNMILEPGGDAGQCDCRVHLDQRALAHV